MFYITFGEVGSFLSSKITNVINVIKDFILGKINNFSKLSWFYHFLEDAIFGGLLSLLAFLPQVALLFFCLTFLEDVGYLPRVAALLDGLLKKVGMTGRSLFSLLMGFGCTATALITTRNLDNEKLKKRTALILPFMSCSAKLPIFLIFASAFFVKFKVLILIALYFFSIVIGIIVSAVNNKINKHQNDEVLILELPKYRLPRLSNLLKSVYINIKHFILKIGTVILISSTIIWILQCFTIKFEYVGYNYEGDNILKSISSVIYPIFRPLGFSSSLVIVVLLSGLIGKEMIISCIGLLNGVAASGIGISESIQLLSSPVYFDINSAISFILFVLLYTPCISTFEVMGKEIGYKFAIKSFIFQFIIAYIVSYIVYGLLTKNLIVILLLCIVLALSILFVIKSCRKNKSICGLGSCYGCNKTCWK